MTNRFRPASFGRRHPSVGKLPVIHKRLNRKARNLLPENRIQNRRQTLQRIKRLWKPLNLDQNMLVQGNDLQRDPINSKNPKRNKKKKNAHHTSYHSPTTHHSHPPTTTKDLPEQSATASNKTPSDNAQQPSPTTAPSTSTPGNSSARVGMSPSSSPRRVPERSKGDPASPVLRDSQRGDPRDAWRRLEPNRAFGRTKRIRRYRRGRWRIRLHGRAPCLSYSRESPPRARYRRLLDPKYVDHYLKKIALSVQISNEIKKQKHT